MTSQPSSASTPAPGDIFATTHWTVVLAASHTTDPQARTALEELCRTYWFPLYAYVRRRGHTREDAEDLTQAFFARFLKKNYLDGLRAERGKFRAFLLASLKHFLANEWDKANRQKRGEVCVTFHSTGKVRMSVIILNRATPRVPTGCSTANGRWPCWNA